MPSMETKPKKVNVTRFRNALEKAMAEDGFPDLNAPNTCDISTAIEEGFIFAAAHLLTGATECPATDDCIRKYGGLPMAEGAGWPKEWPEWVKWYKERTRICTHCELLRGRSVRRRMKPPPRGRMASMARFSDEKEARGNAQANANLTGAAWCIFIDTSGAWNSERWTPKAAVSFTSIESERIEPDPARKEILRDAILLRMRVFLDENAETMADTLENGKDPKAWDIARSLRTIVQDFRTLFPIAELAAKVKL